MNWLSDNESGIIAQTSAAIVVFIVALVFGIQKLMKGWKETHTESNIISLMHDELSRLAEQNRILSGELSKFQLEVVKLNKQIHELTMENVRLHDEVVRLQRIIEGAGNADYANTTSKN